MSVANTTQNGSVYQWIVCRSEPSGQFTAEVVGLPELRASARTRAEAIEQIRALLGEWLASGQLLAVEIPPSNPLLHFSGHLDPNDPIEREFVEELARRRREDLEQTLQEDSQECSNSSSTPTT
jgi:predicted RNase H-like HicB family nuclease